MTDHSMMKLGKLPPSHDPRTLKLARYINLSALPPAPVSTSRAAAFATKFPMFGNDTLGDCTAAAAAHMQQFFGDLSGVPEQITEGDVVAFYSTTTGYNPADPSTDQGGIETTVLAGWRNTGIMSDSGPKMIHAFAQIEQGDTHMVKAASWLFDGVYVGVALPETAQTQDVWDVVSNTGAGAPGSWGGHAICALDYDDTGLTVVTWGALKRMTWAFWHEYVDEAYAIISDDALNLNTHLTAEGFDEHTLESDLVTVTK